MSISEVQVMSSSSEADNANVPTNDKERFRYWAFVSYSHRDAKSVFALHSQLEQYKIPRDLVGQPSREGHSVPARLYPIFIDREEFPSSSRLKKSVQDALSESRYLVVACTENSAKAPWVNAEIEYFISLGRGSSIHCAIVDGPSGSALPIHSVLPPALQLDNEPLAVDLRWSSKLRKREMTRLIAGLVGIDFNVLWNREKIRKRRQLFIYGLAILAFCIGIAGWTLYQYRERSIERYKVLLTAAGIYATREDIADFSREVAKAPTQAVVQWRDKNFVKWGDSLKHAPELDDARYALDILDQYIVVFGRDNDSVVGAYRLPSMQAVLGESEIEEDYRFDFPGPVIRVSPGIYAIGLLKQASSAGGQEHAIAIVDVRNKHISVAWNRINEETIGEGFVLDPGCTRLAIRAYDSRTHKEFTWKFGPDRELEYILGAQVDGQWIDFFESDAGTISSACRERLLDVR